jgi:DNA-binding transcriptional regulator YiaG
VALAFRNIDVDPSAPVEEWGFEGLLAAVDRGQPADWSRIAAAVHRDPWGTVARLLEDEVLDAAEDSGVAGALRANIALQRSRAEQGEREEVRRELAALVEASGLSQGAFAQRLGTSRTRLNTYLSGRVVPSATVLVRARSVS